MLPTDSCETSSLAFRNLNVYCTSTSKLLLSHVSGYVNKGGITAVMGPSGSGKSVLLRALSARIQECIITGDVIMEGISVDPKSSKNPVAYVPQEDFLVGELTGREVTTDTAVLKRNESHLAIMTDVSDLLERLGLSHVADGIIGTVLFRGLSGGQKKRVEISSELIASPRILLMDEPTSGLDSSVAFEVLNTVRELVRASQGQLSVILSIHQPNSRILELFDHILLIDQGSSIFFGSLSEAASYFSRIGFPCPSTVTATDYYLQISDSNFKYTSDFDFKLAYTVSRELGSLQSYLKGECDGKMIMNTVKKPVEGVAFTKQVFTLVFREYTLAFRDPTLYWFQICLMLFFAFLTGAVFFKIPVRIDANYNQIPGGILWLTLMYGWVHVFKVYHISKTDKRTRHELSNNKYSAVVWLVADFFCTATLSVVFFPVAALAYAMMDFPQKAYPFLILNFWMTSLTAEAMLSFITKFSRNPTVSMIFSQIALTIIMVFGGGVFIPWKACPRWWVWLQEMTIFTQASRAAIMEVYNYLDFICQLNDGNACVNPATGEIFPCSTPIDLATNTCRVDGRVVLEINQGIGRADSHWIYFIFLCIIFICFKVGIIILTYLPWEQMQFKIKAFFPVDKASTFISVKRTFIELNEEDVSVDLEPSREDVRIVIHHLNKATHKDVKLSIAPRSSFQHTHHPYLTWTGLSVTLPRGKVLINNVSGHIQVGKVLALMGPSGAGKTTLLNALARRADYARVSGNILFAGRAMSSTDLTYVPQFDEVNGVLTVSQHLELVGRLTCSDLPDMFRRLEAILSIMGLQGKRDEQVKSLTGGELKRVSISIGLISKPSVLFLDEPTTGLDSTASYSIVKYLADIAKTTNIAIILTIHQPSGLVFEMLDDLMLLENGRVVYKGVLRDAQNYFSTLGFTNPHQVNPADYYLDLVQIPPAVGKLWGDIFDKSIEGREFLMLNDEIRREVIQLAKHIPPTLWSRFTTMFIYFMRYNFKEPGMYSYRLGALIAIAVFIGTLFLRLTPTTDNIVKYVGALFFSILSSVLTTVSSTAILTKDRHEAVSRVKNGFYSPGVYLAAQFLASSVYALAISSVFMSIFHWLVNINPTAECFFYGIILNWWVVNLMEGYLNFIIEVFKNDFLCTTSGMVFIGVMMSFCGFFRAVSEMPVWISWMSYVLPLRYAFDGYVTQLFQSQLWTVSGTSMTLTGNEVLSLMFHLQDVNSWGMVGVIVAFVFLYRIGQYLLFAWQTGCISFPLPTN